MKPAEPDCPISILVVDDEEMLAKSCQQILSSDGHSVAVEYRGRAALESVRRKAPDIVLADLMLPDMHGLELLREIRELAPDALVIMITGFATVSSSVEAIEAGAYDYIPKPFTATQLRILIGRAGQQVRLKKDNADLRDRLRRQHGGGGPIVASSPPMQRVERLIERVAGTDASVFLSGESGTGKEVFARDLHMRSRRAGHPFVAVNCAALPDQLLESELFGYEKGAFTGADSMREGLLARAHGGTFFLDEVTEMSRDLQAKLLRVLQERQIRRVGGGAEIPLDVRWISATNRDPEEAVRDGRLRQDLFFRLNVVPIRLPPLRERTEDIPALAQLFLRQFGERYGRPGLRLDPRLASRLTDHSWPGNVRELQNLIERLVSLSDGGPITVADLAAGSGDWLNGAAHGSAGDSAVSADLPFHDAKAAAVATFERAYIRAVLERSEGNISQAAREAGIDRKTIHRLVQKHGLENPIH